MHGSQRLLALDFDGTSHLTGERGPGGMHVGLAYEHAVHNVFGDEALVRYINEGGLRNRAPIEITQQLLPDAEEALQQAKTEDLVQAKLALMVGQIGQRIGDTFWPRLNPGFKSLWVSVARLGDITTGMISSGHEEFIRRSFEVHDLALPDLYVTDDLMRRLLPHLPGELCVKPSRLLLDTLHYQGLERCNIASQVADDTEQLQSTREQILYAGDDHKKDRMLAKNAGVSFVHVESTKSEAAFRHIARRLGLEAAA